MTQPHGVYWEDIRPGFILPVVRMPISYQKVVMVPLATWDLFPGHNDPEFAHQQGQKSIYLNTAVLQGFADRVLTDWIGPNLFIGRRKMVMKGSVFPGDILCGEGQVDDVFVEQNLHKIKVSIALKTQSGTVCDVDTVAVLPAARDRSDRWAAALGFGP